MSNEIISVGNHDVTDTATAILAHPDYASYNSSLK